MENEVTKTDIRNSFVGCRKVTIKQSHSPPYLKYANHYFIFYCHQYLSYSYAFVLHRTNREAEYNRKRPIDYRRFGANCHIEYMRKNVNGSNVHQNSSKWNIVVKKIPENVTEECLRTLFMGCHSMIYIPARIVNKTNMKGTLDIKNKVLWG